jgi:hypothetical protein
LFNHVVTSFFIRIEVGFKKIRKEKEFENGKHDKQFDNDNKPQLSPPGHTPKSIVVKPENFV